MGAESPKWFLLHYNYNCCSKTTKFTNHITHNFRKKAKIQRDLHSYSLYLAYHFLLSIDLLYLLTISDDHILLACYVDTVCVTIWMPKSKDGSRQKYERCRCHEFSSASFCQLSVFTPFMNKSSISKHKTHKYMQETEGLGNRAIFD